MIKRFDIEETQWGYESYRDMVDRPDGDFVHYSDYEKLVTAVRDAVLDLDQFRPGAAKRQLEKALTAAGEEI